VASIIRKHVPVPVPTQQSSAGGVELAGLGDKLVAVVAKDLGISESCLRNWMAQADADEIGSAARLTSAEKKELAAHHPRRGRHKERCPAVTRRQFRERGEDQRLVCVIEGRRATWRRYSTSWWRSTAISPSLLSRTGLSPTSPGLSRWFGAGRHVVARKCS
jgi:hypothetical protein